MAILRRGVGLLLLVPAIAAAQAPTAPPTSAPGAAVSQAPAGGTPSTGVESLGFDYDPESRRDPFRSLSRGGSDPDRSASGTRPAGLAGVETAEVTLKGTLLNRDGYVAMLQSAAGKTYIVHTGDRLLDGTVRAISQSALVIVQEVNDPLSLEKQREVRKTIRQTDEALNGPSRE
jgi:hypothetical protein